MNIEMKEKSKEIDFQNLSSSIISNISESQKLINRSIKIEMRV